MHARQLNRLMVGLAKTNSQASFHKCSETEQHNFKNAIIVSILNIFACLTMIFYVLITGYCIFIKKFAPYYSFPP